jgi:hypothetical protein
MAANHRGSEKAARNEFLGQQPSLSAAIKWLSERIVDVSL